MHNSDTIQFDGANDEVIVQDSAALTDLGGSSDFTVCAWVYFLGPNDESSGSQLVQKTDDNDDYPFPYAINILADGDPSNIRIFQQFGSPGGGWQFTDTSNNPVPQAEWTFIAVRYDTSAGNRALFVDDTKEIDESISTADCSNNRPHHWGVRHKNDGDPGNFFYGRMEYGMVFDTWLSDSEITDLFNAGTQGSLTTATKSFTQNQQPDLQNLSYSLNGESITLDVIGSPGTGSEETVSQTLDGSTSYTLTWAAGHTDFRVQVNIDTTSEETTPSFSGVELVA
jgi:hypothetical protein